MASPVNEDTLEKDAEQEGDEAAPKADTYNLMAKANQLDDMKMCDRVIITPELSGYQVFNLKDINKAYLSGYAAAHRAIKDWQNENEGSGIEPINQQYHDEQP